MINLKKNGSYYTPRILSDFIIRHLFLNYKFGKSINILEPSAGDGIFFDSFFSNKTFKNFNIFKYVEGINIDAVEMEESAFRQCRVNSKKYINSLSKIKYFLNDFLDFQESVKKKYDLVIGNPPYIKYHHLSKHQIKQCESIHKQASLSSKKIKNIWTSFLISGTQLLHEDGVLCFVLPAELLQVIYAKELRDFLRDNFRKIEIFAFSDLVFPKIEQDVIILICSKSQTPGVSFYQVDKLDDLKKPTYVKENSNIHRKTLDKWTNYVLSDKELILLDTLKSKLKPISYYCKAEVGIVTAANDFFIVDKDTVKNDRLGLIALPIVQKSSLIPSTTNFKKSDYDKISESSKPAYLLLFDNKKINDQPKHIRDYIKKGEQRNLHRRYKCKLRENWYHVPSVWESEGFFTKRSNFIPKMAVNKARSLVTDAFYRIKMKDEYKIEDLVFSFYNTLTLIFAELEGRYYGGGVLELTPNEYKGLSIPYCFKVSKTVFNKLDKLLRDKATVKEVLDYTDSYILKRSLGLSNSNISLLQKVYYKLLRRRLSVKALEKSYGEDHTPKTRHS